MKFNEQLLFYIFNKYEMVKSNTIQFLLVTRRFHYHQWKYLRRALLIRTEYWISVNDKNYYKKRRKKSRLCLYIWVHGTPEVLPWKKRGKFNHIEI